MAFLDNSGTIILDAVLTDVGRKRLTQGKFNVSKFLLGDDELDYSLIDMTTEDFSNVETQPLFEAFAGEDANITYGLVSYPSDDITYIPHIKVNTKIKSAVRPIARPGYQDSYLVAANRETAKKIKTLSAASNSFLENDNVSNLKLFVESGIGEKPGFSIPRDPKSRERYILNLGLRDSYYAVSCDSRFIETVLSSKPSSYFRNDNAGRLYSNFQPLMRRVKTSLNAPIDMYETYLIPAVPNLLYNYNGTGLDTTYSMFVGPRSTIFAMNVKIVDKLTSPSGSSTIDTRYNRFGKLEQTPFGGSSKFDIIDTVIYVEGMTTSSRLEIPIKILRYSGT